MRIAHAWPGLSNEVHDIGVPVENVARKHSWNWPRNDPDELARVKGAVGQGFGHQHRPLLDCRRELLSGSNSFRRKIDRRREVVVQKSRQAAKSTAKKSEDATELLAIASVTWGASRAESRRWRVNRPELLDAQEVSNVAEFSNGRLSSTLQRRRAELHESILKPTAGWARSRQTGFDRVPTDKVWTAGDNASNQVNIIFLVPWGTAFQRAAPQRAVNG
jgi:hypothetical protein